MSWVFTRWPLVGWCGRWRRTRRGRGLRCRHCGACDGTRPAVRAAELEAVARAEGTSLSDAVREAITEHIERKRKDGAFRERLRAVMERDREILERLAR